MVTNVELDARLKEFMARMEESVAGLQTSVNSVKTELSAKIDGISARLDGYDAKLEEIEKNVQSADEKVGTLHAEIGNKDEYYMRKFAELNEKIVTLEGKIAHLENLPTEMDELAEEIEDRTNRQLRETLIIKNVPEIDDENTGNMTKNYLATKKLLAKVICEHINIGYDECFDSIKRAHREADRSEELENSRKGQRLIYAAFHSWDLSQEVIDVFREKCINDPTFTISADQKYGRRTTKRRQLAFKLRKDLKAAGTITSGFVNFPAKLMVNYPGELRGPKKVYRLHTNFPKHNI